MKEKKSLRRSKGFKILLLFVYILSTCAAAAGSCASLYLYEHNYYSSDVEKLSHNLMNDLCADDMFELNAKFQNLKAEGYFDKKTSSQLREQLYDAFMESYSAENTNFLFSIHNMEDNVLLASYRNSAYQCTRVQVYQETTYESVDLELSEEEMEVFSFPYDAVDVSTSVRMIEEPTEVTKAALTEIPSDMQERNFTVLNSALLNAMLRYDENGNAYFEGVDENGNYYQIHFDEDGNPIDYYVEENGETADNTPKERSYQSVYEVHYTIPKTESSYYISGYVRENFTARDKYSAVHDTVVNRYNYRYVFPTCAGVGMVLMLICLVLLVSSAGYSRAQEAPGATVFEKIPFDLFTAAIGGMAALALLAADELANSNYMEFMCITGIAVLWGLLALWWLMSIAMRLRTKTMLKNNLLYLIGKWFWIIGNKCRRLTGEIFSALPVIWQAAAAAVIYLFFSFLSVVLTASMDLRFGLAVVILTAPSAAVGIIFLAWNMHILEKGGKMLSEGNLTDKIPEEKLIGRFRKHAACLNSLGDGMNKAVSDRLKSEMFRTELISNVSHDIRTPLTSIINYTNLLANLKLEDAQAKEYIDVLSRQSARLRKLTEDVLEASKATTGNVKVNKETMDFRVLLEQIEGEYAELLEGKHLKLIKDIPDTPLYISADGRLLWRVMDNLFGNICKYAMEGTRVYLNTLIIDGDMVCMLRNISGAQLNISSEELMERFVQGDRSRNTEGSGLGLSIAQSLTTLQGGTLTLQIDGDLFKVTIQFPSVADIPLVD